MALFENEAEKENFLQEVREVVRQELGLFLEKHGESLSATTRIEQMVTKLMPPDPKKEWEAYLERLAEQEKPGSPGQIDARIAAHILDVIPPALDQLCKAGKIPFRKERGERFFRLDDLQQYLAKHSGRRKPRVIA